MAKLHHTAVLVAAIVPMTLMPSVASFATVAAQDEGASNVEGVVRDANGSALAGARVAIVGNSSGHSRTVHTDRQGGFSATGLPAGTYTITVSRQGFAAARYAGMRLAAGGWAQLNAELTPAGR